MNADDLAALAAILTFGAGVATWFLQSRRELRWKRAEAGQKLNDEMQDPNGLAWAAMQMLDSSRRIYRDSNDHDFTVSDEDIDAALTAPDGDTDPRRTYIRDAFDSLFYYMAMFQHSIDNTLIVKDDVAYPMEYYIERIREHGNSIDSYLTRWNLHRTRRFLDENYPGTLANSQRG